MGIRERGQRGKGLEPLAAGLCVPWPESSAPARHPSRHSHPTLGFGAIPSSSLFRCRHWPLPNTPTHPHMLIFGKQSFDSVYLRLSKWSVPLASHQPDPHIPARWGLTQCLSECSQGPAGSGGLTNSSNCQTCLFSIQPTLSFSFIHFSAAMITLGFSQLWIQLSWSRHREGSGGCNSL